MQVLGPLCVWLGATPLPLGSSRMRTVFGLLAVYAGAVVGREMISEAIWGEDRPPSAEVMIQACVSHLRRILEPARTPGGRGGLLAAAGSGYRLGVGDNGSGLDLAAFDALSGQGRAALRSGEALAACRLFEQALDLWQGDPLADVDLLRSHPAVAGIAQRRAALIADYAEAASGRGWHDMILPHVRSLTEREPFNERAHASLMIALAGTGQQAAALEVYQRIAQRLDDQLGVRPSAQVRAAHARVLRQEIPAAVAAPDDQVCLLAGPARTGRPVPGQPVPAQPVPGGPVPSQPVPGQLLALPAHFTGRRQALTALSALLSAPVAAPRPGSRLAVAVITGLPGAGKTALALHAAHHARRCYPDGQLWAQLHGPSAVPRDPCEVLAEFLRALGVPAPAIPDGLAERAALYRSRLADRRVLVVADDAASARQILPLLPGTAGSAMLITSRTPLAAPAGARLIPLGPLPADEAARMLGRIVGQRRTAAEPAAVSALVHACGGLPLAIQIAGARLAARPSWPVSLLSTRIAGPPPRLGELSAGDLSVRVSFDRSYRALSGRARRAFRLLALTGPGEVPERVVAALAGAPSGADVVSELTDASLLATAGTASSGQPRYRLHPLLHAYAGEQLKQESSEDIQAALTRLKQSLSADDH